MKDLMSLGFIGGRRVSRIILEGFRNKGKKFAEIVVSDVSEEALAAMVGGAAKASFESGLPAGEVVDLVPVKPLKDDEEDIKSKYRLRFNPLYEKIKP